MDTPLGAMLRPMIESMTQQMQGAQGGADTSGASPFPYGAPSFPGMPGMGGGMPSPEALKQLGSGRPLPGVNSPGGLPGLPGGLPGLPGSDKKS